MGSGEQGWRTGPGSISRPGVICGLLRGFFYGLSGFPPSSDINISKFQFDRKFEGHGHVSYLYCYVLPSLNKVDLFIYLFIYFI